MTYDLYIGERTFSSWSLRGWLMFAKFDIPVRTHLVSLFDGGFAQTMAEHAPARLVPAVRTPDGILIGETLAIAETLAERHPDVGLWPADPAARACARWLCAEMHAGFTALRTDCPMQLLYQYRGFPASDGVKQDLARLEQLWSYAKKNHGSDEPWLFGSYSAADAFYAPVAARIAGYGLNVGASAQAYVDAHLADPAFRAWRDQGLTVSYDPDPFEMGLPKAAWPGR